MGAVPFVVLDTNILVSAFGWEGPEREVYRLCRAGDLQLAVSDDLLAELKRVLGYPKFDLEPSEIEAVLADVRSTAVLVGPDRAVRAVPDDPADDRVLECALEAGDVGKVVHRYAAGDAYEVEFLAGDGSTLAVLTLKADDLRPLERSDTFHVRSVPRD